MTDEIVSRALGYPYAPVTDTCLISEDGEHKIINPEEEKDHIRNGLTPVIASGSNRSPQQLRRKFKGLPLWPLPASLATLEDHDCVYSAHVAAYGSVPATIAPTPGTAVNIVILWLSDPQLRHLHKTEALGKNYSFECCEGLNLRTRHGLKIKMAWHYRTLRGILAPKGFPIALSEVSCERRNCEAWNQHQILQYIHEMLCPKLSLEDFIVKLVKDRNFRAMVSQSLPKAI